MLTAPLFGIAGACLLLWAGADALHSRWQPVTYAALHCFTAGFMMQAMVGALWQVLPVVGGVVIVRPAWVALLSHVGLTAGAILLVLGMLGATVSTPAMVTLGAALMSASIAILLCASLPGLVRNGLRAESARLLMLALIGLGGTALAGMMLARSLFGGEPLDDVVAVIDMHATWAFAGWSLPGCGRRAAICTDVLHDRQLHAIGRWLPRSAGRGTTDKPWRSVFGDVVDAACRSCHCRTKRRGICRRDAMEVCSASSAKARCDFDRMATGHGVGIRIGRFAWRAAAGT